MRERNDGQKGRISPEQPYRGLDVDETSLAITFIFFSFLILFGLKWIGREDD